MSESARPSTGSYRWFDVSVREDRWQRLRELSVREHEHYDGMNECPICDQSLVDAAIERIEGRDREIAELKQHDQ